MTKKPFEIKIDIRWVDVDMNRHVRHSAYYDFGAHARVKLMEEAGFSVDKMEELQIGPILFEEQCHFLRELKLTTDLKLNILLGTSKEDGSRWTLYHEFYDDKGVKLAHIKTKGAWMDLNKRKLTIPPKEIAERFMELPAGEDFVFQKS